MSYPRHLIQSVLEDCKPTVICTKSSYFKILNTCITTLFLENGWLERFEEEINLLETKPFPEKVLLDDMAYTVYSSGTTGKPKGMRCFYYQVVTSEILLRHCIRKLFVRYPMSSSWCRVLLFVAPSCISIR